MIPGMIPGTANGNTNGAPSPAELAIAAADQAVQHSQAEAVRLERERRTIIDPSTVRPPEPAKPETKPAAAEPKAPTFSPDLLEKAATFGISPEEAVGFGTPAALTRALAAVARTHQAYASRPAQSPAAQPAEVKEETLFDFRAIKGEGGEPLFDDATLGVMQKFEGAINKALREKLGGLDSIKSELEALRRETVGRQRVQEFDDYLEKLPEAYHEFVGKGEVLPGSPEDQVRSEIATLATYIAKGLQADGRPVKSKDVLKRAVNAVLGDKIGQAERKEAEAEVAARIRDAQGRFTSVPTHRSPAFDSEKAPSDPRLRDQWQVNRIEQFMKQTGIKK